MSRLPMPSALPADRAEVLSDAPYDIEADESLREQALDDLVDRLMDGEEYPHRGIRPQINLVDILCDADALTVACAVATAVRSPSFDLYGAVAAIVRCALSETRWVDMRMDELTKEDK